MLKRLFSSVFLCFALIFGTLSVASAYTVIYDCGDGTGSAPETQIVTSGESFIPATNTCTPPDANGNHHFSGWMVDGTDDVIPAGAPMTWTYGTDKILKARYTPGKFSVTAKDIGAAEFYISASGIFTVDCGTGGTLSGNGVDGNTIDRTSNTNEDKYRCTWNTGGVKTITFDGTADGYNAGTVAVVSFAQPYTTGSNSNPVLNYLPNVYLKSINGDLSEMFPYLGASAGQYPIFYRTFYKTQLTTLPPELFSGYTTSARRMFEFTFSNCTGLKSIPENLFDSFEPNTVGANNMFASTFSGCISLQSIPEKLFDSFITGASKMFDSTFSGCTRLTSIPEKLFDSFKTLETGANNMFLSTFRGCTGLTSIPEKLFDSFEPDAVGTGMFGSTFSGCTGLTSIPEKLFEKFTSSASGMFSYTFSGCTGLTTIPENLFEKFTSSASSMFSGTFSGCIGLTIIPENLFEKFTSGALAMFQSTFQGCIGLTTIPENLFEKFTSGAQAMFQSTFQGCTGLTTIPENLFEKFTSGAQAMFQSTFQGCTGLTTIPENLFEKFTSGAQAMFQSTFQDCTGLTTIPEKLFYRFRYSSNDMFLSTFEGCTGLIFLPNGLFSNITINNTNLFKNTFKGCTGLTGYIPADFFVSLVANNSPYINNSMTDVFTNTGLDTSCPSGTVNYPTGYESYWDGHVSCTPERVVTYLCGNGTGNPPANATVGELLSFIPATNTCTAPTNYAFNGWLISGTNTVVQPNNSFKWKYAENKTLTAQWRGVDVSLNWFDGDEELTVNSEAQMCRYGTVISFPTNEMKKTGYHFLGWIGKGE